ncbi:MAG: glutaredoxin family protein [Phototrophicaceae bacterium]
MTDKELVMYNRSWGCPFAFIATRVLHKYNVPYREIYIDRDPEARERVLSWTGFLSVPTLVVAEPASDLPVYEPTPLEKGRSPQGVNRGSMITEAYEPQLVQWLKQNGFIPT